MKINRRTRSKKFEIKTPTANPEWEALRHRYDAQINLLLGDIKQFSALRIEVLE